MKFIAKFIFILVAILWLNFALAQDNKVKIIIPHNNYILTPVIDVYIEQKGPFKFAIDTGASQSSISRELADEIGISYKTQTKRSILTVNKLIYPEITESLNLYISDQSVHRKTNLFIKDINFNPLTKYQGILGVAQFKNGVLQNHPNHDALHLTVPKTTESCDLLNEKSKCYLKLTDLLLTKFSIGKYKGDLLIDTGNQGPRSILLYKTDDTNALWNKYHQSLTALTFNNISAKPLKVLRTPNFTFNDKSCTVEVLLRDPSDISPKLDSNLAVLGWSILQSIPFKIDYKNNHVSFDLKVCPYDNVKTLGITGIYTSADFRYMYVDDFISGSPADKAGLKRQDQVEKVILANGKVITKFDSTLFDHNDQHVYAPVDSQVTYVVRRDGELKSFVMTAEDVITIELE